MLVLFGLLTAILTAHPSNASVQNGRIDPRVLQDTESDQTGDFLVVLKAQANTRAAAARAADRTERARAVFNSLRQAAESTQPDVRRQLDALGVAYRAYWIVNAFAVRSKRSLVDAMAARSDVLSIDSNRRFHVDLEQPQAAGLDMAAAVEWNVDKVNAPALWSLGYTGDGFVYANADTGVQWDHPALKPHYRGWNGTTADHNYNWWDAIHGSGGNPCGYSSMVPCDDHGHGTHTMGIGIGADNSGNQIGVAPGAKWMACRNMDQGTGQPSTYLECMQFFLAPTDLAGNNPDPSKRPDAVGNSYACPVSEGCTDLHVLQAAMENLRASGIFMAVSAGNAGPGCGTVNEPPGLEASAITIGATDANDLIAGFSSRGPVSVDGSYRPKPELVAPGVNVRSSYPPNTYAIYSGTSMAAPHVAAGVLLLWSAFPQLHGNVEMTEFLLEQSAVHLPTSVCTGDAAPVTPNNVAGYGRIDLLAATRYPPSSSWPPQNFLPVIRTSQ